MMLLGNDVGAVFDASSAPRARAVESARLDLGPAAPRAARIAAAPLPSTRSSTGQLLVQAVPALKILSLAAAIMIADIAYASYSGAAFTLGPARAFWLAGPLAIYALFKLALSVMGE
jgi:hypothetical protein